jgi:hypothetical protein
MGVGARGHLVLKDTFYRAAEESGPWAGDEFAEFVAGVVDAHGRRGC